MHKIIDLLKLLKNSFKKDFLKFLFMDVPLSVNVYIPYVWVPTEGVGFSRVGIEIIGCCEPPSMDIRDLTNIL